MEVLERAKYLASNPNEDEHDDGNLEEITVDRPVIPELAQLVQTRAADGEEWSPVALMAQPACHFCPRAATSRVCQ